MLQKLRRASHQLPGRRRSSVNSEAINSDNSSQSAQSQASFLCLPPEIRNNIYERLARETNLSLTPAKMRKRGADPIGLLLACHQTYQEYRSVLLSTANVQIRVSDYNFGNVIRVLEKLAERDVELLMANENLWIILQLAHVPSREDRKSLRAWHDYRSGNIQPYFKKGSTNANKLIFRYDAVFDGRMRPPRPAIRYGNGYAMRLDLLRSHIRMYAKLLGDELSSGRGELHRLGLDMERCQDTLIDLSGVHADDVLGFRYRTASVGSLFSTSSAG